MFFVDVCYLLVVVCRSWCVVCRAVCAACCLLFVDVWSLLLCVVCCVSMVAVCYVGAWLLFIVV